MGYTIRIFALILGFAVCVPAQTTQGLISGQLINSQTGKPITGASVNYSSAQGGETGSTSSDSAGYYYLPLLSPATYTIRVTAESYQPQEIHELTLPVAAQLELNFQLRPLSDVWERGQYKSVFLPGAKTIVTFYGPDIDPSRTGSFQAAHADALPLQSTVSQVVDSQQIADLPLAGRDVYTMLVTQPGVTTDSTTARSLGLSSNGQRPSASNFLLDGIETNNNLVSGPLLSIPPEAIQEYRVSTNNFSAEYGGTSGYIANAITRAGSNAWHGLGYFDFNNDVLNANDFQSNLYGLNRTPLKELQAGFQIGGPVQKDRLFISGNFDYLRSRSRAFPELYQLPTPNLLAATAPNSLARKLLTEYPAPLVNGPGLTALIPIAPPVSIDRPLGLLRVDRLFSGGKHHLMARLAATDTSRPDFVWTPYKDFISGLNDYTYGLALSLESSLRAGLVNEARFGWSLDNLNLARPHSEIPILTSLDGTTLPGSPVFSRLQNEIRSWQGTENLTWIRGRHLVTVGGGATLRHDSGILTAGADGQYGFANISAFAADQPFLFRIPLDRQALPNFQIPQWNRLYRINEFFLFAQDTFKLTRHLVLNYGLRYDYYGDPVNVGAVKDALVQLGGGPDLPTRLANAQLVRPAGGNEDLYSANHNNWGVRLGFSYNPPALSRTVIRGGYGIFYDRLFDNIWENVRNNNFVLPSAFPIASSTTNYLAPVATVLPNYQGDTVNTHFSNPLTLSVQAPTTMFQPGLATPRVQSYFFGIQQQVISGVSLEVNYLGSDGTNLLTTDIVNRTNNAPIGPIFYRANEGASSYNALSAVVRYRTGWAQFQAAYTWSHTIDNQSDVLLRDYFNFDPIRLTAAEISPTFSAFTQEFNSRADRANADFDQRQNLVFFSIFDLPAPRATSKAAYLLRDWKFSQLAAFRSGLPFSVYAVDNSPDGILNQRANLVNPAAVYAGAGGSVPGGERLLNPAAFAVPAAGQVGNTGRNAFTGPGFYNIDISLSRAFALPWLGEAGKLTVRADAFNLLNHANLNVPTSVLGSPYFGIAYFGRALPPSGLPVLSPVNDTSRQIQLILRISF